MELPGLCSKEQPSTTAHFKERVTGKIKHSIPVATRYMVKGLMVFVVVLILT